MKQSKSRLPKFGDWLLRLLARYDVNPHLRGDFDEEFSLIYETKGFVRAWFWYWTHLLRSLPVFIRDLLYWRFVMINSYFKLAIRNVKKHKGYSFINMAGLAIGITCCLYIFLYVHQELSYDRYHKDAKRIYRIAISWKGGGVTRSYAKTSFPMADVVRERYSEIEFIARINRLKRVCIRFGEKVFYESEFIAVEPEFFDIFHVHLLEGGPVSELAQPNTIIMTERMAEKYLGSEDPIGKSIHVTHLGINADFEIIGIVQNAPVNTHLSFDFIASVENLLPGGGKEYWTYTPVYTYVKLASWADADAFDSKIRTISDGFLEKNYPYQCSHFLQPVTGIHLHSHLQSELKIPGNTATILIYSALGLLILLISCLNFINLATAQSVHRSREVGMRKVIGAHRSQIVRQFLLESSFTALSAAVLSMGFTYLSMPYFQRLFEMELVFADVLGPLGFLMLLGCALLIGVGAGSYPAYYLSRLKPVSILQRSKGGDCRGRSRLKQALVILQFVISVGMIISTMVMYRQIDYMKNAPLGFNQEQKLIIMATGVNLKNRYKSVKSEYLSHYLVKGVTVSSSVPGQEIGTWGVRKPGQKEEEAMGMVHLYVDEDFLPQFGIELIAGRNFRGNRAIDAQTCLINEAAVSNLGWKSPDEALGEKLIVGPSSNVDTVIGVIRNFHYQGLQSVIGPLVMDSGDYRWKSLGMITLNINIIDIREILAFSEKTWNKLFPGQPYEYFFLDENFNRLYRSEEASSRIFSVFALLGLFVACLGLLGLVSFATELRTKEIGIRKVLGASISSVVFLLSTEFTKCVLIANGVAWPIAYYFMQKWMQNFAYRTSLNFWIFILSGLAALAIALLTISYQTIKSATANPVDSLRYE